MTSISIDSREGGLGDIWMRLSAAYTAARINDVHITCVIPEQLREVAMEAFGERLELTGTASGREYIFTHRGIRDTWRMILRGRRFACPFAHQVDTARGRGWFRRTITSRSNSVLNWLGLQYIPRGDFLEVYHGLMQISAIPALREIEWEEFRNAAVRDAIAVRRRMQGRHDHRRHAPGGLVVYASGTSHQFVPIEWAKREWPGATYAFHCADKYASDYERAGLRVAFYRSVSELLHIGLMAETIVCTDSFPSHIWQSAGGQNVVLIMTQQTAIRVVHPGFEGRVVESGAVCCPCLPTGRDGKCEAGFVFCRAWDQKTAMLLGGGVGISLVREERPAAARKVQVKG